MTARDWGVFTLHVGDCREVMVGMADASVDSVVCDPPYGLSFMGKGWDAGVPDAAAWAEVLRVLKPGGHMLAFFGTRTYHRGVCAIEDAGFEIRDQLAWAFGSGFPKSHNGVWGGTALKPAFEPIVLARKPLIGTVAANVLAHGTGGLNINGCRVGGDERPLVTSDRRLENNTYSPGLSGSKSEGVTSLGRWPANLLHDGSDEVLAAFPSAPGQQGDLNASAARFFYCAKASGRDRNEGLDGLATVAAGALNMRSDAHAAANGNLPAARANTHPTVKPTDLMRYLCRLITPPGGLVLDPFMGSGSTGKAAVKEGFRFVGIDLSDEYVTIAERRIAHAAFGPAAFGGAAA